MSAVIQLSIKEWITALLIVKYKNYSFQPIKTHLLGTGFPLAYSHLAMAKISGSLVHRNVNLVSPTARLASSLANRSLRFDILLKTCHSCLHIA